MFNKQGIGSFTSRFPVLSYEHLISFLHPLYAVISLTLQNNQLVFLFPIPNFCKKLLTFFQKIKQKHLHYYKISI